MTAFILWFIPLFLSVPNNIDCRDCRDQDKQYLCASNTLPINSRLCIDISEVPAYMYKDYLQSVAKEFGLESPEFRTAEPNYELWSEAFNGYSTAELRTKYLDSDELALIPIVGITFEQARNFARWRTEAFKQYLDGLPKNERSDFPKNFEFRLPTENEWARMRFLYQDKKMIKQIQRIAKNNESAFKIKKSKLLSQADRPQSIYHSQNSDFGFYNIFDNVAEMTSKEGIAMGGSWRQPNAAKKYAQTFEYDGASASVGIRMIFEIID